MKNVEIWLVVAALAVVLALLAAGPRNAEPRVAPDFTLESLDGEAVALSSFRGQVVVLDFWASWCRPCTKTFPEVQTLAEKLSDEGVVLLVVSLDKSAEVAKDYLTNHGFPTDHVLYGSLEAARETRSLYGVVGIPHTFVIDREGLIRYSGYPTGVTEELLRVWL